MTNPVQRDRLGRIVYEGDVTDEGRIVHAVYGYYALTSMGIVIYCGSANLFAIDLEASPERTNYERYFADIGTLDDVLDALRSINCAADGLSCWERPFEDIAGDCIFLDKWLNEKAVI